MNKFRTTLNPPPSESKIGLHHPILTVGSCFAGTMGSRLKKFKFDSMANPFGVLFNPISIHKAIGHAVLNHPAEPELGLKNQDVFYHYDFHSDFSSIDSNDLVNQINSTITVSHDHLKKTKWLIITYGTAWIYTLNNANTVVANCHKMPAGIFTKSLLDEKAVVESFTSLHANLLKLNPEIEIILTVSPVRHVKDTLELNSVSKSLLRVACHSLSEAFKNVHYFPAYEILMDDLRDYRFYNSDMIHPSDVAEDYIWDHFLKCYADEPTQSFIQEWSQIRKDLEHKPFHPASPAHQKFILKLMGRIESFKGQVNIDYELQHVKNQLIDKVE